MFEMWVRISEMNFFEMKGLISSIWLVIERRCFQIKRGKQEKDGKIRVRGIREVLDGQDKGGWRGSFRESRF
jgi:hypothetical protein